MHAFTSRPPAPLLLALAVAVGCSSGLRDDRAWWLDGADEAAYGEEADEAWDSVDEDEDGELLEAAVAEHAGNGDPHVLAGLIEHRDSTSSGGMLVDDISPHAHKERSIATGAPIYSVSGWYDGAYVHAVTKRFNSVTTPGRRLTIGPWDHGAGQQVSPHADSREPEFDLGAELLRFFDHHLKGAPNGIAGEPPVHYFTMGEERRKSSHTWPPAGVEARDWHLAPEGRLSPSAPPAAGRDTYRVDRRAGTGRNTRWESLANIDGVPIEYPDRAERDALLQVYDSAPLPHDLEVTGHPLVTLWLSSDGSDAAVFAYLEDLSPEGEVVYVTEGMLRAAHRHIPECEPPYLSPAPYRAYLEEHARPLEPGVPAELVFDLLPTSYLFRKGHRIRLAFAGADSDHFAPLRDEGAEITFHHGPPRPSRVTLPSRVGSP